MAMLVVVVCLRISVYKSSEKLIESSKSKYDEAKEIFATQLSTQSRYRAVSQNGLLASIRVAFILDS